MKKTLWLLVGSYYFLGGCLFASNITDVSTTQHYSKIEDIYRPAVALAATMPLVSREAGMHRSAGSFDILGNAIYPSQNSSYAQNYAKKIGRAIHNPSPDSVAMMHAQSLDALTSADCPTPEISEIVGRSRSSSEEYFLGKGSAPQTPVGSPNNRTIKTLQSQGFTLRRVGSSAAELGKYLRSGNTTPTTPSDSQKHPTPDLGPVPAFSHFKVSLCGTPDIGSKPTSPISKD